MLIGVCVYIYIYIYICVCVVCVCVSFNVRLCVGVYIYIYIYIYSVVLEWQYRLELLKLCYHPGWRLMRTEYRTCFHMYDEKLKYIYSVVG